MNEDQMEYMTQLASKLGLDVWSEPTRHLGTMDIRVSPEQLEAIHDIDIPYTVFIEDLGQLMANEKRQSSIVSSKSDFYFTKYHTYEEVMEYTQYLAEQLFPHLATFVPSIGTTLQNRSIFAIEFGANRTEAPTIIMNSGIHAREWITITSTQWFITQLLTRYGSDPIATELLNTYTWKIVPILNPDGYDYTWKTDRMWRKNLRKVSFLCTGVDCNRNYPYGWKSSSECEETYPGAKGFSEAESSALGAYVKASHNPIGYVDVHSYSQLWMYPWGDKSTPVPDVKVLDQVSMAAVTAIASVNDLKFKFGSVYSTIYAVTGGSIDYTYGEAKVKYSFGIECRDTGQYGFVQPPEAIIPAGKEMTAGFIAMALEIKSIEGL